MLAAERLASLAKPPGSLGSLEEWAATLCTVQGTLMPAAAPQTVLVFCAPASLALAADWPRPAEAWGSRPGACSGALRVADLLSTGQAEPAFV